MAARLGQSMPVGNEGAGLVVAAGASPAAQALLGRTVAVIGGAMYSQYRAMPAAQCLPLPPGTTAAEGAACFVNPLTALSMVETMKREGHTALVHTAAASNLGQMLLKICQKDGIGLVNIVRKPEQAALLKAQGVSFWSGMRANVGGMATHPVAADLAGFDVTALLRDGGAPGKAALIAGANDISLAIWERALDIHHGTVPPAERQKKLEAAVYEISARARAAGM